MNPTKAYADDNILFEAQARIESIRQMNICRKMEALEKIADIFSEYLNQDLCVLDIVMLLIMIADNGRPRPQRIRHALEYMKIDAGFAK